MENKRLIRKIEYLLKSIKRSSVKIKYLLSEVIKLNIYKIEHELRNIKRSIVKIENILSKIKIKNNNINVHGEDCWYHTRFGKRATKCIRPCQFVKRNKECEDILKYFQMHSVSPISPIKDSKRVKLLDEWQKLLKFTSSLPPRVN